MTRYKTPRDLRAKAEFARDMADLYERALRAGAFHGQLASDSTICLIAALRQAADENDPQPCLIDQHGNPIKTVGQVQ